MKIIDKYVLLISRKFHGFVFTSEVRCNTLDEVLEKIENFPDRKNFYFKIRVIYNVDRFSGSEV